MAMTRAADIIARRLYDAGCRFAFGIPGGEVLTLMDALKQAGLRFVLVKHENAGGFMAEGTWHMTGAPGVLLATIGPGVANAVNVVANAWQDRVPLIFLTGCVDPAEAHSYTHQVFDHTQVLRPITKASLTCVDGAADVVIDKALGLARDGQPGPVHIDVPISAAKAEQADMPVVRRGRTLPGAPAPTPALDDARQRLARAERPLLIAGLDVLTHGAETALAAFVRHTGMPVVTTYKAKGVVPEQDPLCLGGAGLSPKADRLLMPLIAAADLLVLAGYDPIEMRAGWRHPWSPDKPVIELAAVPNDHGMHSATWSFVGDVGAGLRALQSGWTPQPVWPDGQPAQVRAALHDAFTPRTEWGPATVFATARSVAPAETVVTADSGAHRILLSQMWPCPTPRTLLQSTALCTMGCAVPLAMGAKLAAPDRPVLAFVGDAGLEMGLGELATVRDLRLPVVIVVLVDRSLALIELKQRAMQYENVGVDFDGTDFAAVAQALGGAGVTVHDAATLERELRAAWVRDTFTVIACVVPRQAYDGAF